MRFSDAITITLLGLGIGFIFKWLNRGKDKVIAKVDRKQAQAKNKAQKRIMISVGNDIIESPEKHTLVVGASGRGKTKFILEPYLKSALQLNYCGLVYDFKTPVLLYFVAKYSKTRVVSLDFKYRRHRFDLISSVTNQTDCRELATSLLVNGKNDKMDFFKQGEISYLTSVFYYFAVAYDKKITLPHIISLLLMSEPTTILSIISTNSIAKMIARPVLDSMANEKQLSGITAGLSNKLTPFLDKNIYYTLSGSEDFNLNKRSDPKILVLGNDNSIEKAVKPINEAIMKICMRYLNQPNKAKSIFAIDEVDTLYIEELPTFLSTCRANEVASILVFQNLSQL